MKRIKIYTLWGIPTCILVTLGLSKVKWGNPNEVHGEGYPISSVMWEKASEYYPDTSAEDDHFIDFFNPYSDLFNLGIVIVFYVLLCLLIDFFLIL